MKLGRIADDWLPPVLTRRLRAARAPRYRGLNNLDRQLEKYLDKDSGYFVELGANDGLNQSNSWYFERFRGWRGLLVEPSQANYIKCRANRAPETAVFCAACVGFDYAEPLVTIAWANLMSAPIGLDSDVDDAVAHATRGALQYDQAATSFLFGAEARTLTALLDAAKAPTVIDFLSLDVEGAELEVLRGIDHSRYRFRYILVEARDLERMQAHLAPAGYEFVENFSHHDRLFRDRRND